MPARDGTGPTGQGPRTGCGLGNCQPGHSGQPYSARPWYAWLTPARWLDRWFGQGSQRAARRGGRGRRFGG